MNMQVSLKERTKRKYSYVSKLDNAGDAMMTLRLEMYKVDYKVLARQVGVSTSCIMAIRSGRTQWPRPKTFFGLLEALDLELFIVPKGRLQSIAR